MSKIKKSINIWSFVGKTNREAMKIAKDAGFATLSNMVLMGKVMKECDAVSFEGCKATLEAFIPAKKANLIDVNCQALQAGYDY